MKEEKMLDMRGWSRTVAALLVVTTLAGCSLLAARRNAPAPVEDRGSSARTQTQPQAASPVAVEPSRVLPGAENAGRPGYYTVRPGDTLIRIGLDAGQNFRDIQRWNNIDNPNLIEVGQVLRVIPPTPVITEAAPRPVPAAPATAASPNVAPGSASVASASRPSSSAPVVASIPPSATPAPTAPPPGPPTGEDELAWGWPTAGGGTVLAGFDEQRNKGLDISGKPGDPVLASADGRVVYAGAGLRGYGNLIILKHNNTYLSAYAHNQALLVKEDQTVRKGQKIAEMGSSDADRVKLHFEIRRQGKPVDPARYLPAAR
jgi:lipoprotein NlpD